MKGYYKIKEVAEILGVSVETVRTWVYQSKKIESVKIVGCRRIPASEVERLKKGE